MLVLLACMMVLESTEPAGLVGVANESDETENLQNTLCGRFFLGRNLACVYGRDCRFLVLRSGSMLMPRGGGACTSPGPLHVFSISLGSVRAEGEECTHAPSSVPNHHKHRNHHKPFLASVSSFLCHLWDEMMASGQLSASQRRRGRRLRAMLRHEQLSIVMALGDAAQRRPSETDDREGEVHEKNDVPRRQNTPHPGERSGLLLELGPQRSDRSVRRSSHQGLPRLATPSLAGAAGEGVDSSSLQFRNASLGRKKRRRIR